MSQPQELPVKPEGDCPKEKKRFGKPCALLVDTSGGPILFAGRNIGASSDIAAGVNIVRKNFENSSMGFWVSLPLSPSNEDDGFGVCHIVNKLVAQGATPSDCIKLTVKFPRGQFVSKVYDADDALKHRLAGQIPPEKLEKLSVIEVSLAPGARAQVIGMGMPHRNPGHPCEGWLKGDEVVDGKNIVSLLDAGSYKLVVPSHAKPLSNEWDESTLPPALSLPWGTDHWYDYDRFKKLISEHKGGQYPPMLSYTDDNTHVAVLVQSLAQDIVWVEEAARAIRKTMFDVYFVANDNADPQRRFYVVVPLTEAFSETYAEAWRRLAKEGLLILDLYDRATGKQLAAWDAKIIEHPSTVGKLHAHPVKEYELVLEDFAALNFDSGIRDYERKIDAVNLFDPRAPPTNPSAFGLEPVGGHWASGDPEKVEALQHRMKIARAIVRGTGFHDFADGIQWRGLLPAPPFQCPNINMMDLDQRELAALLENVLPADRERCRQYFSERPLGIALINGGPGFGKTTAAAVAAYGMIRSLGPIYVSAPTHVAVDNIATRLFDVSCRAVDLCNSAPGSNPRLRRLLVIRPHNAEDELAALRTLLRDPQAKEAAPYNPFKRESRWKLENSTCFWMLICLRSSAVRPLSDDDSVKLHVLQAEIDADDGLKPLRDVATGDMDWAQFEEQMTPKNVIQHWIRKLVMSADAVCTTPAMSCKRLWNSWKTERARGVLIDEAGNISRPDMYSVWGNTALPLCLVGDEKQLPPTVMSLNDEEEDGVYRNRHALDLGMSALEFLKSSGWPVYRLTHQLRMASRLFELSNKLFYNNQPHTYGPQADIRLPAHAPGRAMEDFLRARFPHMAPSPQGQLREAMIHCKGSRCLVDPKTGTRSSIDQVRVTLDFLDAFVQATNVEPAEIIIITPYRANRDLVNTQKKLYPSLRGMDAATVDGFQGRERAIVVVIFSTVQKTGPGFTRVDSRLNVMFSRQRSFLLLVGDINVTGVMPRAAGARGGRGGGRGGSSGYGPKNVAYQTFTFTDADGQARIIKGGKLREALVGLWQARRVGTVEVGHESFSYLCSS
ncbi:P-loop containing nucleoside triphosphate hydrolase protein [Stachybotrys elegans]|uniref:P-loop containing nucleoside triphosphate hydrolase protein n=1 Tax=Stachybotrys elegans TaxID=80388 RepID=A0A8K0WN99_9HYPO|nr:P-loop containing nucleoside triphosphate hydrolase protein [Stachybotrys elegans]